MPSDIMDQRHISSFYKPSVPSSYFSEEMRCPSEKQVGFWKTASVPDHHGLEAMSFMSGGKAVSSSPLDKSRPMAGNFVDCLELPHNMFKEPTRNISHNSENHMGSENTATSWRVPDQDIAALSKLYGQPASLSAEVRRASLNGGHYSSSSLSDMLSKRLTLSSNDAFFGQSLNTSQSNFGEDEAFGSLQEIEAQTIGDLLPDDDDLLSGAIHNVGCAAQSSRADVEDDLFYSVGGMELEPDDNFSCKKASEYDYGGAFNGQVKGLDNLFTSEIPCGQQPTRTLFVKNIDSNIEDFELRVFFEQYGDIQTLYTSCRHCGFILVSYYDIRAAQNAIRVLQSKSIRGQKLDIEFCLSKDNHSEKDINEGVLLVTNLESSISNDDLLHLFGVYGEIKEIWEIPHQQHHKFIEFYDVRAAEAALSALNMRAIAGKRIKVQPCGLRDARFSLMQQLSVDPEEEEPIRRFVPSGLTRLQVNTSSGPRNGSIQGMRTSFDMQSSSSVESKFRGTSSSMLHNLSFPSRVAVVGNHSHQSGNSELSHSLGQMNLDLQSMPTFPEFRDGVISGIPFNSPSTMSAMAMSINSALANGNIHGVGSGGHGSHSFEHNEAAFSVSGNESCPLHGHEYIWNNSNAYHHHHHPSSMMWQNLPPFVNNMPAQTSQVHGLVRGLSHVQNPVLSPNQHVGSAPAVDPLLWDRRHTFTGDATAFHPSSLGSMGYSGCSQLNSLDASSRNIFPHSGGTCIDPSIGSAHVGVPSPQQRSHMFRGRNHANAIPNSHDTPSDRIRSRRSDPSANQADSRKQYELDIERIIRGEDSRTTLMIKNIPNKYTSKMLLATIDEQHKGTYDFIYLPIDFKNKCNVGYAFINMTDPRHIIPFYQAFNGKKWEKFNSEKVAYLAYARIQGKTALISHFQNSSLMNEDKRCRPILFHSDGPNAGDQEAFPVGVNIRSRRSRTNTENHHGSPSGSSSGEESLNATGSLSASAKETE